MGAKILEYLAKFLLLPLIKEFGDYILKQYKEYEAKKETERRIREAAERSVNENDQRPVEREINPDQVGEYSGRGTIRDSLPNTK